jgi:hypothetical protein
MHPRSLGCIKSYSAAGPLKSSKSIQILCHDAHLIALQIPVMLDSLFQKWYFTKDPSSSVSDLLMSSHKAPLQVDLTCHSSAERRRGKAGMCRNSMVFDLDYSIINGAPYSHYIHLYSYIYIYICIYIYPIKLGLLLDISYKLGPINTISLYPSIIIYHYII